MLTFSFTSFWKIPFWKSACLLKVTFLYIHSLCMYGAVCMSSLYTVSSISQLHSPHSYIFLPSHTLSYMHISLLYRYTFCIFLPTQLHLSYFSLYTLSYISLLADTHIHTHTPHTSPFTAKHLDKYGSHFQSHTALLEQIIRNRTRLNTQFLSGYGGCADQPASNTWPWA